MATWNLKSKRKSSGGILNRNKKKKLHQRGSEFLETVIEKRKIATKRKTGGKLKIKLKSDNKVNVSGKGSVKIVSVEQNPANIHYVRRNILTKGSVVKTDIGLVRVTSRPGQDGLVNGILVEEKKA
ncbi:MAG: 30S ribosomal protein S8e [Candidatus Aenigmarchaeota archaeon]|nr:30S ribosomal protein S8e [Candidatus Aenigmarchaeota archaeon]